MNDKCASGTGATIDKCMLKVGYRRGKRFPSWLTTTPSCTTSRPSAACLPRPTSSTWSRAAFPRNEILNSLGRRDRAAEPLGAHPRQHPARTGCSCSADPTHICPFLQECWRKRIPEAWDERGYEYPKDQPVEELIYVPENSEYYAAYGAVLYGMHEPAGGRRVQGPRAAQGVHQPRPQGQARRERRTRPGRSTQRRARRVSRQVQAFPSSTDATLEPGQVVRGVIGLDGGSTSSKCVFMDEEGEILKKCYQLSKGNPIQDMKDMFAICEKPGRWTRARHRGHRLRRDRLRRRCHGVRALGRRQHRRDRGAHDERQALRAATSMSSATSAARTSRCSSWRTATSRTFKLSNQCSAGNGMLLQAMADQFGLPVTKYAENAFEADLARQSLQLRLRGLPRYRPCELPKGGLQPSEELLAGLAQVLPKNVWQYVVGVFRGMAALGRKFVLQGGTQYNLAAVKAQVDYIKERVPERRGVRAPAQLAKLVPSAQRWKRSVS